MNVVCVTAITAAYDSLKPHPDIPGVDWVAFTDSYQRRDDWDVRPILAIPGEHPRLTAKRYKLLPHVYLPEYGYNIWLDGSFEVTSPLFVSEALACIGEGDMAMWRHGQRDDLVLEGEVSMTMAKYQGTFVREQVARYLSLGFPRDFGLWSTGVLVRRTHSPKVIRWMEAWMEENRRWSYQDQISFPFILWQAGLGAPDGLPPQWSPLGCPWFVMRGHNPAGLVP